MDTPIQFEEEIRQGLYNKELEYSVLATAIFLPDLAEEVNIEEDYFYQKQNKIVWRAISQIKRAGGLPDYETLIDEIERMGELENVGGVAHVTHILSSTVASYGFEDSVKRLADYYHRRLLLRQANWIASKAYDFETEVSRTQDQVIIAMSSIQTNNQKSRHISEVTNEVYAEVERAAQNPQEVWGMDIGFVDINRLLGGLHTGETFYLAGAPGAGKSILANQIGAYVGQTKSVWLCSLEMQDTRLVKRLLSAQGEIPTRNLNTGYLSVDDWTAFTEACGLLSDRKIHIWDHRGMTLGQFRAEATRLKRLYDIQLIVLDYLYLLAGYDDLDMTPRTEILSTGVQTLAEQLDVAILAINSVVKEGMKGYSSNMADIRGSGQMIHNTDILAFIRKASKSATEFETLGKDLRLRKITFEKLRDGDVADGYEIQLGLTTGYPKFVDLTVDNIQDINIDAMSPTKPKQKTMGMD